MNLNRKDSIYRQREALAQILRDPLEQVAHDCIPLWETDHNLENILLINFSRIPYCAGLYALDTDGIQITENVCRNGIQAGYLGRDRSERPYMKTAVPAWGFLLCDVYTSQYQQRPLFTAVHIIRNGNAVLGYLGADFDLRDLPLTSRWFQEGANLHTPEIKSTTRQAEDQTKRLESFIDKDLDTITAALEELLTRRGVFQCQVHFASGQVTICTGQDPFRYHVLRPDTQSITESLQNYPHEPYPARARIPEHRIKTILSQLRLLRRLSETLYLRQASINIFNGMINLSLSCDGSQYLSYEEFLQKNIDDWFVASKHLYKPVLA